MTELTRRDTTDSDVLRHVKEPLDPELALCLTHTGSFAALRHPLVYQVPYFEALAWHANEQLRLKTEAVKAARASASWHRFIWLHERPYRAAALQQIARQLHGKEYWELLRQVWVDSENVHEWGSGTIRKLFTSRREGRDSLMTEAERQELNALPATLRVYRGYPHPHGTRQGWSWTLDENRAHWFARRFASAQQSPRVASGQLEKRHVIAYLTSRGESEVVTDPRNVTQSQELTVS